MLDGWLGHARRVMWPFRLEGPVDPMVDEPPIDDPAVRELRSSILFTTKLARALLGYGLPIFHLEEALFRISQALGFDASFYLTPTGMIATFELGGQQRTQVLLAVPGSADMSRLVSLNALVERVERGELSPTDASRRVDAILERPPKYGALLTVLATSLLSAAMVPLLDGNLTEVAASGAIGLAVGLLIHLSRNAKMLGRLMPSIAAFGATVAAYALVGSGVSVRPTIVLIASVIGLVPGLTLTIAMIELATANLVSGTARLMGALVTFLQIGFGAGFGHAVIRLVHQVPVSAANGLPPYAFVAATIAATIAFVLLLQIRLRDTPWVLLVCSVAVVTALWGGDAFGPEVGAFVGALTVGVMSNLFALRTRTPSLTLLVPGILMLVPGIMGFLSLTSLLEANATAALHTGFQVFLIAMALTTGVLVATLAVPPRRPL